jgi:hypothetical protein
MKSRSFSTERSFVFARLPKAGLGNKLFVWAEALVFARLNGLPLVVSGWCKPQVRNWMRCGDLRLYWNYFTRWKGVSTLRQWTVRAGGHVVKQPVIEKLVGGPAAATVYEFADIPHWKNCFEKLVPHREMIRTELREHLTAARLDEINKVPKPVICVQVRLGDFRALKASEQFAMVGGVRTPLDYFKDLVADVRRLHGSELPVTLVSDGSDAELAPLLTLPAVQRHRGRTSIADLMLMADSKLLVCAAGSTYSQWGGFLGDPVLLHHPDHFHYRCRSESDGQRVFEGAVQPGQSASWPPLLKACIAGIGGAAR